MTTPARIPAGQPPTAPAAYVHRTWVDEMADVLGLVAGIYRDFEVMDATLIEVRAGRKHLARVGECRATGLEIMTGGVRFVERTDARYIPVFEAIQQAGGVDEVAQDKRYHDHD